ncbi:MAG: Glu/Leu/Phe/Val dehydrogenase dimerization domain-containing protein, partial [Actinomycetales bacterium]
MATDQTSAANPWAGFNRHERVLVAADQEAGLRAIVAVHSTALGPALGGTRFLAYQEAGDPGAAAYADALRLSHAMSLKNALAGLPHGGGKGVILAPTSRPSESLLEAYGREVAALQGQYVTAGDVGISVTDLDV